MATKILQRRVRTARPQPRIRRLVLTEADYILFQAIDRHGPLPSGYLYEFTRHLRADRTHLQNRLTEFYNGDTGGGYLLRPPQQFAGFEARYQHLVYDLAPRARQLLAERETGAWQRRARSDPFVHRLMSACVSASFELTVAAHGLRYISLQDILSHSACDARLADDPLAVPLSLAGPFRLIPDLLFGLEYPGTGFRFFAVEIDRNTESIERRNLGQSSFARKIAAYETMLAEQTYRAWWGIPNLHVLVATTSATHARAIIRYLSSRLLPEHRGKFAVTSISAFGSDWRVPRGPLINLLDLPWLTVCGVRSLSEV